MTLLPKGDVPERTSGREGFYHVYHCEGAIEEASVALIVRDHDKNKFQERKQQLHDIVQNLNDRYGNCVTIEVKDQYYNMKEKITPVLHIVDIAKEAMEAIGIAPIIKPIRGGTHGAQLSYMGLPWPNIFAEGYNFHGKYEYVPVESMQKAVEVIVKICEITASR